MKKIVLVFLPVLIVLVSCRSKKQVVATHSSDTSANAVLYKPFSYFRFERDQVKELPKGKALFDIQGNARYNKSLAFADSLSPAGSCWISGTAKERQQIMFDQAAVKPPARCMALTVETALRFDPDSMDTYRMGFADAQIVVSPGSISFAVVNQQGKPDVENRLVIGSSGKTSVTDYLYDGEWHHLAFTFEGDSVSGTAMIRFFIDGKTAPAFRKKVKLYSSLCGNRFHTGFLPENHSSEDGLDEVAIWFDVLPDGLIQQHSRSFFNGQPYSEKFSAGGLTNAPLPEFRFSERRYDSLDFAPGFPEYTVSQQEQLEEFPLPRFHTGTVMPKNFPWYDFMYMAYDYRQVQADTASIKYPGWKTKVHAQAALSLDSEMYYHWNYYFLVPSPTFNSGDYVNRNTIYGKLAAYADRHPEVKIATIVFWTGVNPSRAGYASKKPYIRSNHSIDPCNGDTLFPDIALDGLTQRKNLEALIRVLPHRDSLCKIDFVNENGEVFGESWTPNAEGYRNSSLISCIQRDSSTARADRARWQYRVFKTYSSQFANTASFPCLRNTKFSFYQVAGFMPRYYSDWKQMRPVNARFHGMYYSTPDFYPGNKKYRIWETHGPYHGLDVIRDGRKYEISQGDLYFSPFICAGWGQDSLSFRPAEWLAACKALGMMGAEFYYPAFFNTANPARKIPQDPRGYIYQVAMPVYAQATTSWYAGIFYRSRDFVYMRNYNRLTIYRKDSLQPVYAILACVFPLTNYADAIAGEPKGEVNIDGEILVLAFSEQGNTFIYDKRDPKNIVFYQVDGWHEARHPYYWSKNFVFEAELCEGENRPLLRTERPAGAAANDYTEFTTYVRFSAGQPMNLLYRFEPRTGDTATYQVRVRARSSAKKSTMEIHAGGQVYTIGNIEPGEFRWYTLTLKGKPQMVKFEAGKENVLELKALDSALEIDKVEVLH